MVSNQLELKFALHDKLFSHHLRSITLARSCTGVMLENVFAYFFCTMQIDLFEPITVELMNTSIIRETTNETYHCITKLLGTMISVGAFRRDDIISCARIA
jgi:hypothetical protein